MSMLEELKRRQVVRVGIAYLVGAWVVIEVSSLILEIYEYPGSIMRLLVALLAIGLPIVLFFAWAFEVTPEGIKRESEVDRSHSAVRQTGKRLTVITVAFLVIGIGLFALGRFTGHSSGSAPAPVGVASEPVPNAAVIAHQVLEVNRLRDAGNYPGAFALAEEIAPHLGDDGFDEVFWEEISESADIVTDPPGARVVRQTMSSNTGEWLELGTTPLHNVRFARAEG